MTKLRITEINLSPTSSTRDEEFFGIVISHCSTNLSEYGFVEEFGGQWLRKFAKSAAGLKECNELMPKIMRPEWTFDGMFLDQDTIQKLKS